MQPIALIIQNEREKAVLEHYFQSLKFDVLILRSDYNTYRTIAEANPLCVICELPTRYLDNLYLIKLLGKQKKTEKVPIIAYGNHTSEAVIHSFYEANVGLYYQRPLQSKLLVENIEDIKKGRSIKIKRYRSVSSEVPPRSVEQDVSSPDIKNKVQDKTGHSGVTLHTKENSLSVPSDELDAVEMLMNPVTSPEERVEIIISRVKEMLAFPFTIVKILEITQNNKTGAQDLAKAIDADPVIVSTLLGISNTVNYARLGKRINDVQEAIVRLGFVETKNIALSLSVMSMFSTDAKCEQFDRFEFWYHSLACGIMTELLARKANYPSPEKAFICGLLHDFGIILLDEFFNAFFNSIYMQVSRNKSGFIAEEKRLWGMSHNAVVTQLFKNWNMPSDITRTIEQLDMFTSRQIADTRNMESILVNSIGLSNLIVKSLQLGKDCDSIIHPVNSTILTLTGNVEGISDDLINICIERLNLYSEFFNLSKHFGSYPPPVRDDAKSLSIIDHSKEQFFPHRYYLTTCGYQVHEASSVESIKSMDEPPHAILNLINSSIPEKYLEPIVSLPQGSIGQNGQRNIPAIFLTHDNKCDLSFKSLSNAYCLPANVEMNLLCTIVQSLIAQKEISAYDELAYQSSEQIPTEKKLSLNYLNDSTVLISLCGIIRLANFNDIRLCLMMMIDKKVSNIAIQIDNILDIDNLMTNLLVNFQKKASELGCTICFCCIGKEPPDVFQQQEVIKSIQSFNRENDIPRYFEQQKECCTLP